MANRIRHLEHTTGPTGSRPTTDAARTGTADRQAYERAQRARWATDTPRDAA